MFMKNVGESLYSSFLFVEVVGCCDVVVVLLMALVLVVLFMLIDGVDSSLNRDAILNIERMLFTMGPTCLIMGIVWFIIPSVLDVLFISPDQFIDFIPDKVEPNLDSSPGDFAVFSVVVATFLARLGAIPLTRFGVTMELG